MPFCTTCGKPVLQSDTFCATCGTRQRAAGAAAASDHLQSITPRTLKILCYVPVLGWIACIVALAAQRYRDDHDVRFHAFQGLYLFVIWLLIDWVISPFLWLPGAGHGFERLVKMLLTLAVYGAWILMLIKTSQNENYSLPIVGELAERSVAEQR